MKKFNIKFSPLDSRGISHFFIPLALIVLVAIGGTYTLVASHAATCDKSVFFPQGKPVCDKFSQNPPATTTPKSTVSTSTAKPVSHAPFIPVSTVTAPVGLPASTEPTSVAGSSQTHYKPKPKPSGDIVIVTYVDDPAIDKTGGKDHRLGGVSIKVDNQSGPNNCDNRKNAEGTTNKTGHFTPKDSKTPVLVKGTMHYLNCDTGKYKVTLVGRKGYTAVSPSVREFTLNNNETQRVFFVMKKTQKAKPTTSAAPAATPTPSVGGAAAPSN